jgi:ribonuclease HI
VEALTSHLAKTAAYYTLIPMINKFRILQLNVGRRGGAQHSLLNDQELREYSVLAIQEPTAIMRDNTLLTIPMAHREWTKITPSEQHTGRWAFSSMLWINIKVDARQIPIASPYITAALLTLPTRQILVASIYIPPADRLARTNTINHLQRLYQQTQGNKRIDVIFLGDFNLHDQLWGGDDVPETDQGEADELIDLMGEIGLSSLLPRGTKTWQNRGTESTIDIILASTELAEDRLICQISPTDHGSDHRAIQTTFDIEAPIRTTTSRLLFKNAPWKEIKTQVATALQYIPVGGPVQWQTDRLMEAVTEAIYALTPRAKPSLYAKRWWTMDLTKLRKIHTYNRNQARSHRRAGRPDPVLEKSAKESAKEYHDAIRKQKRAHWQDFLAEDTNIWEVAKYLKSGQSAFDRIPPLNRTDGTITASIKEQANELIQTFFPPLPEDISSENQGPGRATLPLPPLTLEEVEQQIFRAKPWKAAGADNLPAIVWKELWPVVKERVLALFQQSLDTGEIPDQWREARIIPLKKPDKEDYTKANAWRPISLLSTLGKALEAVIAERISSLVETHGLLPTNHFGARKQRSAEQALILLQEYIYNAWRAKKVLSLVSFDIKGAYNGVCKERLIQRLQARGISPTLTKWINAFCSSRRARIIVNGETSQSFLLSQAGLPQGSPLSPILFLFFNADLVQQKITKTGGSVAFIDDYTAWVIGDNATANRPQIEQIIDRALAWERSSGATFEGKKTSIIHFTRDPARSNNNTIAVKGQQIRPKKKVKILGVVMDSQLRFKQHIARAGSRGLEAALALRRLRGLSPATSRQLFTAAVAPVVDYASTVWSHACTGAAIRAINRVQRVGAQAVTGAFQTVATAVAEAEANLSTTYNRFKRKALKLWIKIQTLPATHPLAKINTKAFKRFISPLQKIAAEFKGIPVSQMETISPFTLAPWEHRLNYNLELDRDKASNNAKEKTGLIITTSCSQKNNLVGIGFTINTNTHGTQSRPIKHHITIGTSSDQNPFTGELQAISKALAALPQDTHRQQITIFSSNLAAIQAITQPKQQSGQESLKEIYQSARHLITNKNAITISWIPAQTDFPLAREAKELARITTQKNRSPITTGYRASSTALTEATRITQRTGSLPQGVGSFSRKVDIALPGNHTKHIYNKLRYSEASILIQLRTGMCRLNSYLAKIGAAVSDLCPCGTATETIKHFLFRCPLWRQHRTELYQQTASKQGNLSFFLGGRARTDPDSWTPNHTAIRATIKYAQATGRLNINR